MDPAKALEASAVYGINNVMLILISFFLAGLVIYIVKQSERREIKLLELNEKREQRLADIINKDIKQVTLSLEEHDKRSSAAIAMITEAHKYVRAEHESMIQSQEKMLAAQIQHSLLLSNLSERIQGMKEQFNHVELTKGSQ